MMYSLHSTPSLPSFADKDVKMVIMWMVLTAV